MKKFNKAKYPKTFAYVTENDTLNRRCDKCGCVVLKETSRNGYPYQCIHCDEDLYGMETHIGTVHTEKEFDQMCEDALILELDN